MKDQVMCGRLWGKMDIIKSLNYITLEEQGPGSDVILFEIKKKKKLLPSK